MSSAEKFKPISGFEGFYEVGDRGTIRSVTRVLPHRHGLCVVKGRPIKAWSDADGYQLVALCRLNVKTVRKVHRLVAETFINNPMQFPQVNHLDCNKTNNTRPNLEWCSHKQNHEHATAAGRHARHHKTDSKLSAQQVREIRATARSEVSTVKLAEKFGVHRKTVEAIRAGKAWRSIDDQRN